MSAAETTDRRNLRRIGNRANTLDACRRLMLAGDFRPTMKAVATAGGVSVRSVFQYFGNIEDLWREALDIPTIGAIAAAIYPIGVDEVELYKRSVYVAVFGALPPVTEQSGALAGGGAL